MSIFFKALEQAERDRSRDGAALLLDDRAERDGITAEAAPSVPRHRADAEPPAAVASPAAVAPPVVDAEVDEHLVSLLRPGSAEAERYRGLRHAINNLRQTRGMSVIAVSSPTMGDGKTTTAINTAGALAQAAQARVLLVDLDLRHASLALRLGCRNARPGLADAVARPDLSLADIVRHYPAYNLDVLPAGTPPELPYEVVDSPRLGALLDQARQQYEYVLVDTPPLAAAIDARVIGQWVDGFLLVVAAHRTPRRLLEASLDLMDPTKLIGLVFNDADQQQLGDLCSPLTSPWRGDCTVSMA